MNDLDFILFCILPAFIAVCAFTAGWLVGRRSRKIDLSGLGAQEAFAFFLAREKSRHRADIAQINSDLKKLDRAGIMVPNIPLNLWIEVVPKWGTIVPGKGTK